MLWILTKKQLFECFKGYLINTKTGKVRSRLSKIVMFSLFTFIMLMLCGVFAGLSYSLIGLLDTELCWLYYAISLILSLLLGVFGSVFNTFATLYKAKDNDLLLAMPIRPKDILMSRMALVCILSLLYSGIVWLPSIVMAWIFGEVSVIAIIFQILMFILITLLASALTCALGYVVALISSKIKNKSIVSAFLTLAFLGIYYYFCFRASNFIDGIMQNIENIGGGIRKYGNLFYQLALAATGKVVPFIISLIICGGLFALCIFILSKTFIKIVTKSNNQVITNSKVDYKSSGSMDLVLLKREAKRFVSSTTYLLNTGIGIIFILGIAVIALIKRSAFLPLIDLFSEELPEIVQYIPLVIIAVLSSITSINAISSPSVSLEGKTLWIIKSLPVKTRDIIKAKESLHVLINGVPTIIASISLAYCFKLNLDYALKTLVINVLIIVICADFGLVLGILRPNFNWTNETQPIKQSMNVLFAFLFGWLITAACVGLFFVFRNSIELSDYLMYVTAGLIVLSTLIKRWLYSKGVTIFERI